MFKKILLSSGKNTNGMTLIYFIMQKIYKNYKKIYITSANTFKLKGSLHFLTR